MIILANFFKQIFSKKYFPPILTILIILIGSLAVTHLLSDTTIVIESDPITLRESPATNATAITEINPGDQVSLISSQNGWHQVRYQSQDGWIPQWLLENDNLTTDQNLYAQILVSTPLYESPNEASEVVMQLESGIYIAINYESNGWVNATFSDGVAYFPTRMVNLIPSDEVPETIDEEEIIDQEEALEMQRQELEGVVVVRMYGQPLLDDPSYYADFIYDVTYNQEFTLIETVEDVDGNEFYFVEDENGTRGYLEDRIVAMQADSVGHVGQTNPGSLENAKIMIDPGHGGIDPGAISYDDLTYEKNVALETSLILQEYLEEAGAEVILTRTDDSTVDLEDRPIMSNEEEVDAFLSIHYDAALYADWEGITTYFFHEADSEIAETINNHLSELNMYNNGSIFGNYHVMRENDRPSILLELGYMSSYSDLESIRSEAYYHELSQAIVDGLTEYFANVDSE